MNNTSERLSLLRVLVREMRLAFLTATLVPVTLGTAVAWALHGSFYPDLFILTAIAASCLHIGTNIINDYYDHVNRTDDVNVDFVSPFSGGSRVIQEGLLHPRQVFIESIVMFGIGGLIGLYLYTVRGIVILALGAIGAFSGFFYSAPPFKFQSRGIGELFIGLNFGVLMVFGAYYVQYPSINIEPMIASLPVAFLVIEILYINQFPDFRADEQAGKRTLVVRLGLRRAAVGYVLWMTAVYLSIVVSVVLSFIHPYSLAALGTLPLAVRGSITTIRNYASPLGLIPAYVSTINAHLLTGSAMAVAYILVGLGLSYEYAVVLGLGLIVLCAVFAARLRPAVPSSTSST